MKKYTANDYGSRAVKAAHRVLIELTQMLDEYEEHTVIVGGWVPPLLMPHSRHIGSIDVGLAIDHKAIQGAPFGPIQPLQVQASQPSSHHYTSRKQFAHLRGFQMLPEPPGARKWDIGTLWLSLPTHGWHLRAAAVREGTPSPEQELRLLIFDH